MTYALVEQKRLLIAAKTQGRGGQFFITDEQKSGLLKFFQVPKLPAVFYKTKQGNTYSPQLLVAEDLDFGLHTSQGHRRTFRFSPESRSGTLDL